MTEEAANALRTALHAAQVARSGRRAAGAQALPMNVAGLGQVGAVDQLGPVSGDAAAAPGPQQPLIGILRQPVKHWKLDAVGKAVLDSAAPLGDRFGALDPSALLQALQRLQPGVPPSGSTWPIHRSTAPP